MERWKKEGREEMMNTMEEMDTGLGQGLKTYVGARRCRAGQNAMVFLEGSQSPPQAAAPRKKKKKKDMTYMTMWTIKL